MKPDPAHCPSPEEQRHHRRTHLVLFVLLAILSLAQMRFAWASPIDADEVEHAHVAWLMSNDVAPYREFHQVHMPLLWICTFPLFKVLPESTDTLLILRAICLVAFAGSCIAGLTLLRRMTSLYCSPQSVLYLVVAIALVGQCEFFRFRPDPFMVLCVAWAIVAAQRIPDRPVWYSYLSGLLVGIAVSFSQKAGPLALLVPILCVIQCRRERDLKPMLLTIPNVLGLLSGLSPMLVWLWANGLVSSFVEWVAVNGAHSLSAVDLSAFTFLEGSRVLLVLAIFGGVALLRAPFRRESERVAATAVVVGAVMSGLVFVVFSNRMHYNLQAFAIPGGVLIVMALRQMCLLERWRGASRLLAVCLILFLIVRPVVHEGIQVRRSGKCVSWSTLQTLIQEAQGADTTCVGFAPFHPIFCRDATDLYLGWDLQFAQGTLMSDKGSQPYRRMWRNAVSEIVAAKPDVIVLPGVFEIAHGAGLLSTAQLSQLREFVGENYDSLIAGNVRYLARIPHEDPVNETPFVG